MDDIDDFIESYDCHDLNTEPRPDSVVYQQAFLDLKQGQEEITSLLREPLVQSTFKSNITQGLLHEVMNRTKTHIPDEVMFAIAGDMNSGKSSVINSILSIGTIARKGDGGGSCTWVVQRFRRMFPDQSSPYVARVHFFSLEQIREIITSLLTRYFRARPKKATETDCLDDCVTGSDDESDRISIVETLVAMFCDQPGFEGEEEATVYLERASTEHDEGMIDELMSWAQELIAVNADGADTVLVEASTPGELIFRLQSFTYTLKNDDAGRIPAVWPLVSAIDFAFDHSILNEGITFVDTPGLSDANTTRASNTLKHHRMCTHKITVADIARAKDDKSLRENLVTGYRQRGSGNTILVITKGDSIDSETDVSGMPLEKRREAVLKDEIDEIRKEKRILTAKRSRGSREDRLDPNDQIRAINAKLIAKLDVYDSLRMEMRNRSVLKELRHHYKSLTQDPHPLHSFIVGNEAYKKHQAGYYANENPGMTVRQTQIPALRHCIYSVPAQGKLNEALHQANVQIPSLLNSFELYCSKTHMARKSEIEQLILQPVPELQAYMQSLSQKLRIDAKHYVLAPMSADEDIWVDQARKLCTEWAWKYEKGQLNILRKEGFVTGTKKKPEINWNLQLIKINEEPMTVYFHNLQNRMNEVFNEVSRAMGCMMDNTSKSIRNDPQYTLMALKPFLESFRIERPAVIREVQNSLRSIKKSLSDISDLVITASPDAYLVRAMRPVYASVEKIRGKGAPQTRAKTFTRQVAKQSGVWIKTHDHVEVAMCHAFDTNLAELVVNLTKILTGIHSKFNIVCDNSITTDVEEKRQEQELQEVLQKNLLKAVEISEGRMQVAREACKNYGKDPLFEPESTPY
ncbi:hypothetical protein LTR86_000690 [Recurvomyces mirabilis]|nr:hypothetical protein LTR86_000690 [Recurvomyces mirabilis]